MTSPRSFRNRQGGNSLLEVLISVLIFSMGILGTTALLANSVRASNDARYRSEAANLAGAMVADIWAMAPAQVDAKFGTGGSRLDAWKVKAAALLPAADTNPPVVDLAQPGLSLQSRTVVVTVFWQLPGSSELHSHMLTAQIGKNP